MPTLITREKAFDELFELNETLLNLMWVTTDIKHVNEMRKLLAKDCDEYILNTIYTYATTAEWVGGSAEEEIPLFLDMCEMDLPQYLGAGYDCSGKYEKLETLYELLHARVVLDPDCGGDSIWKNLSPIDKGILTRRQVALLEGKKEDTIRNAVYASGDACLKPFAENLYRAEDVIRWQKARGTFKATVIRRGDPCSRDLYTTLQLKVWFEAFCTPQSEPSVTLEQISKAIAPEHQQAFSDFWNNPARSNPNLPWFTVESASQLAELLGIKPRWLATQVHQCRLNELPEDDEFEDLLKEQARQQISASTPISAELIRQTLGKCDWIEAHAFQRGKANAKMDGYTSGRLTFTHEHNLKTQYLWLPRGAGEPLALPKKLYEKKNLNIKGDYGRHSGLKKYTEIAYEDLYKVEIHTYGDLQLILERIKP